VSKPSDWSAGPAGFLIGHADWRVALDELPGPVLLVANGGRADRDIAAIRQLEGLAVGGPAAGASGSMVDGMTQAAPEIATEHPHIVRIDGIEGGRPHVRGTGLSVELIARFYKMGATSHELLGTYPQLTPAALYDALSYYHDHQTEIDRALVETNSLERVKAKYGFTIGDKGQVIFGEQRRAGQPIRRRRCRSRAGATPPHSRHRRD
jgi:uncharacterized protein (DUF433 family)